MQSRLRSTVAAVLLLAPLAAPFVAQPAAAARAAPGPSIDTVSLNSDAGVSAGATLRVQLKATPDARRASVTLGDSGVTIPLREQSAGQYTGSYVVRRADRIDPTQLMAARVTYGERTYSRSFNYPPSFQELAATASRPERHADRAAPRDQRAPQITDLMPANGERTSERGRERVGAQFSDEGSGIDPATARLRLNGRDVTDEARATPEGIRFRGQLDPGRYRAEVSVKDNAGNRTTKWWTFDVADRDRDRDRVGAIRDDLPLEVSGGHGAAIDPDGNLAIRGRTAPLANVRVQVASVADAPGVIGMTRPVADQTVQADRDGRFSVLVTPRDLPAAGTRFDVHVTASDGRQTADERITLYQRRG